MPNKIKTPYIRSSELSEYLFCSVAWYLQRQGYKPDEKIFEEGHRKHIELGKTIDSLDRGRKITLLLEVTGTILILIAFILILQESFL
ncbi:MAG: hypothetical protein DRN12_05325 [Thermoplasmata archaeon]|nr:MAG: hypothetical protein DRN12_05325 [Thermoplasmata archaeon]HEC89691.1 hypothetical protein [Thermoplasmatales archaeon]